MGKIELSIIHDISKLRVLASKLLEEKEDLLHFEEQFENDRNHMYSFEEIEIELIEKSLNIIKKENEILEIIESINKIKENIEIEFRTILGIKKSNI